MDVVQKNQEGTEWTSPVSTDSLISHTNHSLERLR
jgi:hypothetical protein